MSNFLKIAFLLFLLLPRGLALAIEPFDVVINEIAWMGTENSANDEWIEIYNNSSLNQNLDGWQLITEDKTLVVNLEGNLEKGDFFIIERTDDQTLPGIKADLIYKGSLNNKGESLRLISKDGELIDEVNCSSGWFAGENDTKRTMERKGPLVSGNDSQNWQTSQSSGGTPKVKNGQVKEETILEKEILPATLEENVSYPSGIYINEILPSPEGPDDQNEWIEFSNQNNFEVNLFGWKLKDFSGQVVTYTFPEKTIIQPNGYLVFYRPVTKIILNNEGDKLTFFSPDGKIVNEISYENSPRGQSWSRNELVWYWNKNLTPGNLNVVSSPEQRKNQESPETPTSSSGSQENHLKATLREQFPKEKNLYVAFIALTNALFSGIIILTLRKRLIQRD